MNVPRLLLAPARSTTLTGRLLWSALLVSALAACSGDEPSTGDASGASEGAAPSTPAPVDGSAATGQPGAGPAGPAGGPPREMPEWAKPFEPDGKERPNIVLVVLDTLRRDATGLAEPEEAAATAPKWPLLPGGLTPNLNNLAEDAAVFTHAYSVAPWTVPSHASMFTGLLPTSHGCVARAPRLGPVPTIAELLRRVGYETAAFYSNPWLSERASGLLRGFELQQESPIGDLATLVGAEGDQGGGQTMKNIDAWLAARESDAPFLMFVNVLEAHLPYAPPSFVRQMAMPPITSEPTTIQWAHEYNAGLHEHDSVNWQAVQDLYAADVRFTDELFGVLLNVLKKHEVFDDTILIVTSDHGENLGDHHLMEHQYSLHETLLSVPLLIRTPGGEVPQGRHAQPVMTTDLFSTIAELASAARPTEGRQSMPLMRSAKLDTTKKQRPVFADYSFPHQQLLEFLGSLNPDLERVELDQAIRSVRVGPIRMTVKSGGSLELFDMAKDPRQTTDLSKDQAEIVQGLRGLLKQAEPKRPMPRAQPHTIDPETQKQLQGLGYVTGDEEGR